MKIETGIYNDKFFVRLTATQGSSFNLYKTSAEAIAAITDIKSKFEKMSEELKSIREAV